MNQKEKKNKTKTKHDQKEKHDLVRARDNSHWLLLIQECSCYVVLYFWYPSCLEDKRGLENRNAQVQENNTYDEKGSPIGP